MQTAFDVLAEPTRRRILDDVAEKVKVRAEIYGCKERPAPKPPLIGSGS